MEFIEITENQFRDYAETSPYQSFMQTPEIAELRAKSGWTPYYFAVVDTSTISQTPQKSAKPTPVDKSTKTPKPNSASNSPSTSSEPKILAATLAVAKPTFLGKYQTFYTPGGPMLDLENQELTDFFLKHLADFARSKNAYVLHIDPYFELRQRDRDGKLVANGFDRSTALENLKNLGFKPFENTSMPHYLFAKDLPRNATPEAVFAQFKQNTRNLTRRAERLGVKIRELNREELPILKQITASTADRRHFVDQPLSYYETMYDLFAPKHQIKFLLAEVDGIPLSVAMFMLVGNEVVYLYSGSDDRYMKKYNAQYLIQWHMIRYALEHGFARYNFYGIRGLPDPKAKDYGIYRFKKGFGGHVVELIGSFELPLNRPIYHIHSALSTLKHLLK